MEIRRSQVVAKRLWNVLRIAFFMIRKGVISKRKLMMDMNLMMKRGRLLRKSLSNLIPHHHHHSQSSSASKSKMARGGFGGVQEYYEFSCSNSPNPVFSHVPAKRKWNHQYSYYFPCINSPQVMVDQMEDYYLEDQHVDHVDDEPPNTNNKAAAVVLVPKTPDYYAFNFRFDGGDQKMMRSPFNLMSPFSVRVSSYSSSEDHDHIHIAEDDDENENENGRGGGVDDQAEEFITRFYEQLRAQSRMQFLQ